MMKNNIILACILLICGVLSTHNACAIGQGQLKDPSFFSLGITVGSIGLSAVYDAIDAYKDSYTIYNGRSEYSRIQEARKGRHENLKFIGAISFACFLWSLR